MTPSKKSQKKNSDKRLVAISYVKSFITEHIAAFGYSMLFAVLWLKPTLGGLTYGNLDPSFTYGVEKAADSGISFGDKFISTYGPMSYGVVNYLASNVYKVLIFSLLTTVAVGFGLEWFGKLYLFGERRARIMMSVLLVLSLTVCNPERLYLNLFVLYLFIFVKLKQNDRQRLALCLAAVSAIFTLMKFTIGFGSLTALIFAVLLAGSLEKTHLLKRLKQLLPVMATYLVILTVLGFLLSINNIFSYLSSSLIMSAGFSNAMSFVNPTIAVAAKYLAAAILLLLVWLVIKVKRRAIDYAFLLPVLFVFWKYCVVRQDLHILAIVEVLPFLCLMVYVMGKKVLYYDGLFLATILIIALIAIWSNGIQISSFINSINRPLDSLRHHRITAFFNVPYQKSNWDREIRSYLMPAKLSSSMRAQIGEKGVDIFPWEAVIVKANDLNWQNRPSPFSFESYAPQFDNANAIFMAERGPEYIVWHSFGPTGVQGIDERNILWDEPETLKSILAKYEYVQSDKNFILLKRLAQPTSQPQKATKPGQEIGLQEVTVPQSNSLLCLNLQVKNNVIQTLEGAMVRERPFYININYEDGTVQRARFIRETSTGGLLINQLPKTWNELKNLLKDHQTIDKVKSISIVGEPTTTVSFSKCLTS